MEESILYKECLVEEEKGRWSGWNAREEEEDDSGVGRGREHRAPTGAGRRGWLKEEEGDYRSWKKTD